MMKRIVFLVLFVLSPVLAPAQGLPIKDGNSGTLADVMSLAGGNPLMCAIVDTAGAQIGSFGGGTQYTEGDTDASITGTALLWEDAADTLRAVSVAKPLPVDGSAVTQPISAASLPLPTGAATETTLGTRLAESVYTGRTPAGASPADNESNTNTALSRVGVFGFLFDGTTWDRAPGTSADGALVNLGANNDVTIPANSSVNLNQIVGAAPSATNPVPSRLTDGTAFYDARAITSFPDNEPFNLAQIVGTAPAAHDALMSGDAVPLTEALFAETPEDSDANTSANRVSADADKVRALGNRYGVAYTNPCQGPFKWTYHENSSSALTDTTVHASCGAGLKNYICSVTASTGAATAWNMFIEESTTTTILGPFYLEAVAGRGFNITFAPEGGKAQPTAATLISVTTSAAIAHSIDIQGVCAP